MLETIIKSQCKIIACGYYVLQIDAADALQSVQHQASDLPHQYQSWDIYSSSFQPGT